MEFPNNDPRKDRDMKRDDHQRAAKLTKATLFFGAATVLSLACGQQSARAQVITEDPGLIAQIGATVTSMSNQLTQLKQITGTVTSVLNVQKDISGALGLIGVGADDIGGSTVGQLISSAKMGFSAYQQAKNAAEQIVGEVRSLLTDPLGSLSLLNMFQAINTNTASQIFSMNPTISTQVDLMNRVMNGSMTVSASTDAIARSMYIDRVNPTSDQIEAVTSTRRAVVQNAAITAMTAAAATNQSIANDGQTALANLSSGVANASDLRGDIKANSAVVLKICEQVAGHNAMLGRLIYLESATVMANQGVYGPRVNDAQTPNDATPIQPQASAAGSVP